MADISVSNVGGSQSSRLWETASGKTWLTFAVAFAATVIIHAFFGPALGAVGTWVGTGIVFGGAAYFVANGNGETSVASDSGVKSEALQKANTNIMLADAEMNITYMNDSMRAMFKNAEGDIRTVLPNFNVDTLIGTCADVFHKDPAHQRAMINGLRATHQGQIDVGPRVFGLIATPIFREDGTREGTVIEWEDRTARINEAKEAALVASDNARVRNALDGAQTNVMLADPEGTIIYMNTTMVAMMANAESDIRKDLPRFNAATLMGTNMDTFHKDPSYQQGVIENLKETISTSIVVGGRTFGLVATPIFDDGVRLGTSVEWDDRTDRLAQEASDKAIAMENSRVKTALDGAQTNVMMADNDFNIIYMNTTMVAMMVNAESDIKKVLPSFNASKLMGTNIDQFHKDPSYQRKAVAELTGAFDSRIEIGVRTFSLIANPINDEDGTRLGTSVEWEDITEKLADAAKLATIAQENERIKTALDGAQTNVMMADPDFNIIYMNTSMQAMMDNAESEIVKDLPNFSAAKLLGTNIDQFHKVPAHQRKMVGDLTGVFEGRIKMGARTFDLIANPINDEDGNRLGTSVEWADRTADLAEAEALAEIAQENGRIKTALDGAQTNVMMADNDFNIIYMNDSMQAMMDNAESDIKVALPSFNASKLMGTNIDQFHKVPSYQRKAVGELTGTFDSKIEIGVRSFSLIANPIHDADGKRLGTSVEWEDITDKLAAATVLAETAEENGRIKTALDGAQTNVMLADNDFNIIYMNTSMQAMMDNAESEIVKDLPNFSAATLMGTNIDQFHKVPAHQRKMVGDLKGLFEGRIMMGARTFDLIANPINDEDGNRLGTSVEWADRTEDLAAAAVLAESARENGRIKTALDGAKTNVMLADPDFNIIYMNDSMQAMMDVAEEEIRKDLPNFDAATLMGTNIDQFHKVPAHQRRMVGELTGVFEGRITMGARTFDLIANPINDEEGDRLGTSVEWADRTADLAAAEVLAATAADNGRIKTALDGAKANVMLADPDFNIIYMNASMEAMMKNAESDIKKDLPNFNASTLMGTNIDGFHKDPSYQRKAVGELTGTFESSIVIGGRTFTLIANPINDEEGTRLGTSVEWADITEKLKQENVEKLLAADNGRIKTALDGAKANVMLADPDFNIIYMNASMVAMMQNAEADIKKDLPNFNASTLMGTNIDGFHKDPSYQRKAVGELTGTFESSIVIGGRTFTLIANPINDEEGTRLGTSVEWADVTEKLAEENRTAELANENGRIKTALDGAKTNVMLADNDFNIIYMNASMQKMMDVAEEEIRKDLPNFNSAKLMGTNIDQFHKVPAHQRRMVGELTGVFEGRIQMGARTFDLIANPINDADGNRLGTSVEWADRTQDLAEAAILSETAQENGRIKTSLDGAQTSVMIADNDFNIIYMNVSMQAMMDNAERQIRKDLPTFRAAKLMGTNIDQFHKVPSHQRNMVGALTDVFEGQIVIGGRTFSLIANPVMDEATGDRIGTSVEWEDLTDRLAAEAAAAEIAAANAQIKQALDKVTASVMVADADMHINYMNDSMITMFKMAEADIRKVLPAFDSNKLMGANPDIFHKNPSHQRGMITALQGTHSTEIAVGERLFSLIANPVLDESGERLGTVVEWGDVTLERAVEREIAGVVEAAVTGDLTQRIDLEEKEGFMLNVSTGINQFAETCDKGLNDVATTLASMAGGDLTARIEADYQGTWDELKQNTNATGEKLSEVLGQIATGAGDVGNAATEIASGSADLSERTEQQASALEETAASMEEMESAVKTNAENAASANTQGTQARDVAEKGGVVVNDAVEAMSRIEESSQKISDIIVVIDEIAFQTNLLALNAAVEAARAGDAGKGFAVVASEVRALAQRSSEAAKDIKGLIVDSNNQVKTGVELVNEAGTQLGEIVTSIKGVTDLVSEIAAANQEQATGIAEINKSIAEMDEMTQQNSALVEETAASARQLEDQSEVMQERVSFFTTDVSVSSGGGTPRAKAKRPEAKAKAPASKKARKKAPAKKAGGDDDWAEF
ncbi:MAG: hypothetical protein COB37_07250 [Kordiimonadales bacterium]|nr:MAG: hypothetical protein COB37_07250 [Kordiimonadales bacterium]